MPLSSLPDIGIKEDNYFSILEERYFITVLYHLTPNA